MYGNVTELGDASRNPGKSYLFFLTDYHHEIDLVGDMVLYQAKHITSDVSGAFLTALENPRERIIFTAGWCVGIPHDAHSPECRETAACLDVRGGSRQFESQRHAG